MLYLGSHIGGTHLPSLGLAAGCLALTLAWPQSWRKLVPPQIVAVIAGGALGWAGCMLLLLQGSCTLDVAQRNLLVHGTSKMF